MPISDAALVERTVSGDPVAFGTLVERYKLLAYSTAFTYVQNIDDAQDLAQESFVKAFLSIGSLKNPATFPSWLRRIVANVCKDWLKKRRLPTVDMDKVDVERIRDTGEDEIIERIRSEKKSKVVARAVDSLPERYRQVVLLRYFSNLSYEEIGEFLKISKSAVNIRLVRARILLRKKLANVPDFTEGEEINISGGDFFAV